MRNDGYPWLYYEISDSPNEGHLQSGSFTIDDLPEIVSQCLWMYQGVFFRADEKRPDIINLPHAFMQLEEGIKLVNVVTNAVYEIVDIIGDFRSLRYKTPSIEGVPESIKIPQRLWFRDQYNPSELVGATVQIKRLDDDPDQIDLVREKGHFLSLPASNRPKCRLIRSEQRDLSEGKGEEDRQADIRPGFEIEVQITREGPNEGNELFGDTNAPLPRQRRQPRTNKPDLDFTKTRIVYTITEDAWIDFFLKAPTGRELGWMVQWFKVFMFRYLSVIERVGYTRVIPIGRFGGDDASLRKPETGDAVRLRYGVRTETIYPSTPWKLRGTIVEVETKKPDGETPESLVVDSLED